MYAKRNVCGLTHYLVGLRVVVDFLMGFPLSALAFVDPTVASAARALACGWFGKFMEPGKRSSEVLKGHRILVIQFYVNYSQSHVNVERSLEAEITFRSDLQIGQEV